MFHFDHFPGAPASGVLRRCQTSNGLEEQNRGLVDPGDQVQTQPISISTPERPRSVTIALIAALQFADIITTEHALAAGTAIEGNPVMAWYMLAYGPFWWVLPKLALITAVVFLARRLRANWPFSVIAGLYGLILENNLLNW